MRNEVKSIAVGVAQVKLTPESDHEKTLLKDNVETDTIELYYHKAVEDKLPGYVLLQVMDQSEWPYAAMVRVQKIVGIG